MEKKCCIHEPEHEIVFAMMIQFGATCSGMCNHIGKITVDCESCEHYHEPKRSPAEALANVFKGVVSWQ